MIHVCIMGGHEGRLSANKKIYLTLFGATELVRPTVARQLLVARQHRDAEFFTPSRHFFMTVCGAVEIKSPTLAEEFVDLRELVTGGKLHMGDWDRCMADLARSEGSIGSFTLMAGFAEAQLPSESEEIDSLAVQQHLGNISENAVQILKYGIGQREGERRATLRKALSTIG